MLTWGIVSYQSYHLSVYRAEIDQGNQVNDYRINVANKTYHPTEVRVRGEGLPADAYRLDDTQIAITTAGRKDLHLRINDGLPAGLYTISVFADSGDGWLDRFQILHMVGKLYAHDHCTSCLAARAVHR